MGFGMGQGSGEGLSTPWGALMGLGTGQGVGTPRASRWDWGWEGGRDRGSAPPGVFQ